MSPRQRLRRSGMAHDRSCFQVGGWRRRCHEKVGTEVMGYRGKERGNRRILSSEYMRR